ncbi:tetratricopeptide repeat protein [Actinokineospora pegani]|uniref:tetratricopeptide repeat protein n=1 Tax=Actinokineospora pegani TaxID=2654637 RepID=UPI0012EA0DB0|nr:tetratricopeptide repeat protein [Actinokineospora pegani]
MEDVPALIAEETSAALSRCERSPGGAALAGLGAVHARWWRFGEAAAAYGSAVAWLRGSARGAAGLGWGRALTEACRPFEALAVYRLFPGVVGVEVGTAWALLRAHRPHEAIQAVARVGTSEALTALGSALAAVGRFDDAVAAHRAAVGSVAHVAFGESLLRMQRYAAAEQEFRTAARIAEVECDFHTAASAFSGVARVLADIGDLPAALDHHNRAISHFHVLGDRRAEARARHALGLSLSATDPARAVDAHRTAITALLDLADHTTAAVASLSLAHTLAARQELPEARAAAVRSSGLYAESGDRDGEARAHAYVARLAETAGDLGAAESALRTALELWRELGDPDSEAAGWRALARVVSRAGRVTEAAEADRIAARVVDER